MFAISQLILSNTNFVKNNLQSYSIIIGLVLYASVYLYLLYSNHHYLTFYNNFIVYIVLIDLLIAGFMFYKRAKTDKLDISNTDLVNFLTTKDDYDNVESDTDSETNTESDADTEHEDNNDDDEHDVKNDETEKEELNSEIPEKHDKYEESELNYEEENYKQDDHEESNLQHVNLKDMFSNMHQLNFGNIDFNKMQQELIQSGILGSTSESKIEEIVEPLEKNEPIENQNEMTEASDLIEIPVKKKRGRKPKNSIEQTETQSKNPTTKIQISK
jgi:hypothetical protein